jgi:hypothetical protein
MACSCAKLDWTGVDQTNEHHLQCKDNNTTLLTATGVRMLRENDLSNARPISDAPEFKLNWTCDESGRSNSSHLYHFLSKEIAALIRNGAFSIVSGQVEDLGHLIVAQLAHKYNVGPLSHFDVNAPPPSWDKLHSDELDRLREWRDKLYYALPYWMGFNSPNSDEFFGGLLAWIAAHRYGSPSYFALEQSWRLQTELRQKAEERIKELESRLSLTGKVDK